MKLHGQSRSEPVPSPVSPACGSPQDALNGNCASSIRERKFWRAFSVAKTGRTTVNPTEQTNNQVHADERQSALILLPCRDSPEMAEERRKGVHIDRGMARDLG